MIMEDIPHYSFPEFDKRIRALEKELESLKARYELLHDAVPPVKEFSGYATDSPQTECEHDWGIKSGVQSTDPKKCYMEYVCFKCQETKTIKPTLPCDHDWSETQWATPNPNSTQWQRCMKCGVRKIVNASQSDKPTQTLAGLSLKMWHGIKGCSMAECEPFAKMAEEYYSTLLQSEYQRGKEETIKAIQEGSMSITFEAEKELKRRGITIGRKQAIEEMKEKFEELISGQMLHTDNVNLFNKIRELFTESK